MLPTTELAVTNNGLDVRDNTKIFVWAITALTPAAWIIEGLVLTRTKGHFGASKLVLTRTLLKNPRRPSVRLWAEKRVAL